MDPARIEGATPPPLRLERASSMNEPMTSALRRALGAMALDGNNDDHVRQALRDAVRAGRRDGLYVEHVILRLKLAWGQAPESRRLTRRARYEALDYAITMCIEEYYREVDPDDEANG